MSIEDAGVAGNEGTDLSNEVPQAITDKFNEIFSNSDVTDDEPAGAEPEKPQFPTKASQAKAAREQTDELKQEGLEDEDGVEPEAETVADPVEEEAPAEEAGEQAFTEPLDPNLRFAAQQFGWTDDKIDKLYAADPEMAAMTFTNLLGAFTNLSRQGGLNPAQQPASQLPNPAAQLQQQAQQSKFLSLIGNLKEFTEANGEPLGDMLKALHEEVYQPLMAMRAEYAVAKQQQIAAEASTTTTSLSDKFPDFYGKGEQQTLVHKQNLNMLYQWADRIRAGAADQGREMSVKDAINKAHLILTADKRVAEGRQQVRSQVQKRAKSITARPTQRVNPRGAGVSKGDNAAAEAYSRRAQELGIEVGYGE